MGGSMTNGLTCEHPGCKPLASAGTSGAPAGLRFYCAEHRPTDGQLLLGIRHEEHERYMDSGPMRRMLAPGRVATIGPSGAHSALLMSAMLGGQYGIDRRPLLAGREVERELSTRDRLAAEALAKAEAK